jgi:DNA-binding LacI/PurR family transcriptional regulator
MRSTSPTIERTKLPGKRHIVSAKLRDMAIARGPGAKLPTRDQLCADLGTSPATVDDVLRDLEAANVIYRRQGSGIFVSEKLHTKNIRVLINAAFVDAIGESPFWGLLWGGIVKEGQKRSAYKDEDIHFQLVSCDGMTELPPDIVRLIENGPLDGLLAIGMSQAIWAVPKTIPMVSFAGSGHWHVALRTERVIAEAARRLAALGCTKIGFWMPSGENPPGEITLSRFTDTNTAAFQGAVSECGLPYYPEFHHVGAAAASDVRNGQLAPLDPIKGAGFQAEGDHIARRLFGQQGSPCPDGIVIADDLMACGALAAFRKLGIRPGEDVKIASHSNAGLPLLYGWEDEILLWQADPAQIVASLFATLDRLMAGEDVEQFTNVEPRFLS